MATRFDKLLSRRQLLGLMAMAGTAVVVGCSDDGSPEAAATSTSPGATATAPAAPTATSGPSTLSCIVSPEMTEGPYFVDEQLDRSDIRSDPSDNSVREGVPLVMTLNIQSVSGDTCTPLVGALVDVWHCDAAGVYSDVAQNNTVGQKFLRGYQLTDGSGNAQFTTIYPGWYMGRAVHIHFKVRTDPEAGRGYEFTSQIFFDETTMAEVYAQAPYNTRGMPDTPNASDSIYGGGGNQMIIPLTQEGQGYTGELRIGVQMA